MNYSMMGNFSNSISQRAQEEHDTVASYNQSASNTKDEMLKKLTGDDQGKEQEQDMFQGASDALGANELYGLYKDTKKAGGIGGLITQKGKDLTTKVENLKSDIGAVKNKISGAIDKGSELINKAKTGITNTVQTYKRGQEASDFASKNIGTPEGDELSTFTNDRSFRTGRPKALGTDTGGRSYNQFEADPEDNLSQMDNRPKAPTTTSPELDTKPVADVEDAEKVGGDVVDAGDAVKSGGIISKLAAGVGGKAGEAITDIGSKLGKVGKIAGSLGKVAGVIPGAIDAYKDISEGKIDGNNWEEKAANITTMAGTALSFIPGLDILGAGLDMGSLALGAIGDHEETVADKAKEATAKAVAVSKAQVAQKSVQDVGGYLTTATQANQPSGSGSF